MSDMLIRNVSSRMKRQIKERARTHGRSLSEEVKELIDRGLQAPQDTRNVGTFLEQLVPSKYRGDDLVFEYRGDMPKPPDFG
jgi:plasmid stability protein